MDYSDHQVCVYYCSTYYKAVRVEGGSGGHVYERRRAEACVDEAAHHALVNGDARGKRTPSVCLLLQDLYFCLYQGRK